MHKRSFRTLVGCAGAACYAAKAMGCDDEEAVGLPSGTEITLPNHVNATVGVDGKLPDTFKMTKANGLWYLQSF